MTPRYAAALTLLGAAAAWAGAGCQGDGCVGGDDGRCVPPTACGALHYSCDGQPGTLRVTRIGDGFMPLLGPKARGAIDDILMENDLVRVVLDAPSHPSGLAPSGGSIIDLASNAPGSGDQMNAIYQAAGLLPRDAVHYESYHIDEHIGQAAADMFVAVVFRGRLEGDSRVTVVTRYELRACEPGVRVRTDLYNGAPDPNTLYLADGLFWGDHAAIPFVPGPGLGFRAPEVDLLNIASAWREWPFVAARTQAPPDTSYAVIPCDRPQSAGFNDPTLSASGLPLAPTLPGDGVSFERFIVAAGGTAGLAPAASEALRVRAMVHGDPPPVSVTGRVVAGGVPIAAGSGRAASLLFYEPAPGPDPDDPARRTPWTEAVPVGGGRFTVALPADRTYRVQPYAFGLPAAAATSFVVAHESVDIGDLTLAASAQLRVTVATAPGQPASEAMTELVLVPFEPQPGREPPSLYGLFPGCDPMLGPPHGGSPACNRALSTDGSFDLPIPPGQYNVYATRGPFASIDRRRITVLPGSQPPRLEMVVEPLSGLLPAGVLSADFHVHGAASYDSSMPDQDRVASFLAAGLDVVVATDHDVATSYAGTLGADRLTIIPGVEQTPNILWFTVPGEDFPKTLGHLNFWPLAVYPTLPTLPRNGVPWDELREPAQMMDDFEPLFAGSGVRHLNHPFAGSKLGRDQGFLTAIGYDPRTPIVPGASFAADLLLSRPGGAGGRRNLDWDVQEVMNGSSLGDWLRYRAFWFSLLFQGIVRAGTANSDSHSLALEQVGYPRNLVFGDPGRPGFDLERFNEDVRRGHMVGTNGPVLDVTIEDVVDGVKRILRPGIDPIHVSPSAQLVIKVATAPWIPVTDLRVIVNGELRGGRVPGERIDVSTAFIGADHLGTQPIAMSPKTLPLSTLREGMSGDVWLVVEVGFPLPAVVDSDDDGLPELREPVEPPDRTLLSDYVAIVPGAWPLAFTNPFLIDVDGNGWQAPGLAP